MNHSRPNEPESNRRRLRFSLRTLFIGVSILSVMFGGVGIWNNKARQRRLAAAEVEKLGGRVYWDVRTSTPNKTLAPRWLTKRFPPEYFGVVASVSMPGATDEQLDILRNFKQLKSLYLDDSHVSDDGLRRIAPLSNLTRLTIHGSDITDDGLVHLSRLRHLKYLVLQSSRIQGPGFAHLATLSELDSVAVESPMITDDGIQYLRELARLRELKGVSVWGTHQVTEAGALRVARHLSNCYFGVYPAPNTVLPPPQVFGMEQPMIGPYFQFDPGEGLIREDNSNSPPGF